MGDFSNARDLKKACHSPIATHSCLQQCSVYPEIADSPELFLQRETPAAVILQMRPGNCGQDGPGFHCGEQTGR
jgi:hypothetical protein